MSGKLNSVRFNSVPREGKKRSRVAKKLRQIVIEIDRFGLPFVSEYAYKVTGDSHKPCEKGLGTRWRVLSCRIFRKDLGQNYMFHLIKASLLQ